MKFSMKKLIKCFEIFLNLQGWFLKLSLAAEIGSGVLGTQANFSGFGSWLRYCTDVAQRRSTELAHCLAVSWAGTPYIHFRGILPPNRILPGAEFTFCPILAFSYVGSITAQHSSSGHQPNFVAWYKE